MSSWPPQVPDPYSPQMTAFLDALASSPEDVTPWLVFADWLEEHGDPRAELLRWGARVREEPVPPPLTLAALELAGWQRKHLPAWLGTLPRKVGLFVAFGRPAMWSTTNFLAQPNLHK